MNSVIVCCLYTFDAARKSLSHNSYLFPSMNTSKRTNFFIGSVIRSFHSSSTCIRCWFRSHRTTNIYYIYGGVRAKNQYFFRLCGKGKKRIFLIEPFISKVNYLTGFVIRNIFLVESVTIRGIIIEKNGVFIIVEYIGPVQSIPTCNINAIQ